MSRIPTEAPTTNDQTSSDHADRQNRVPLNEGSVGSDGSAEAKPGKSFQPSSPSDIGLEEPNDTSPETELSQSVAEKFGIDDKHLYHKPSRD